ncbi:MAG: isochorismatase family protein [Anaerolineae bacterium]|nr:isochorismatase family protein [Anaerolineae bacterium]
MKPALLVIDVQKAFFDLDATTTQSLNHAIEYINAAIDLFRKKGLPIVSVQHIDQDGGLVPGKEGFNQPESLKLLPSDLAIHKTYGNAFNKTDLEAKLRGLGVDAVVLTGFCAEFCVLATCQGAEDIDLNPMILRNAIASGAPERIKFVEDISAIISYGALKNFLA